MKNKHSMLGIWVLSIALLSAPELASAGKDSGLYLGGSVGDADMSFSRSTVNFDDSDTGYKIFGGFNFGFIPLIDFAVEGSYVDFGDASDIQTLNQNVGVTAWSGFGLAAFNLGPIGVFGKVGQAWWDTDSPVLAGLLDDSGNDTVYGLGARFQLGSAAIRAEWEVYDFGLVDIDYLSVGASWTF